MARLMYHLTLSCSEKAGPSRRARDRSLAAFSLTSALNRDLFPHLIVAGSREKFSKSKRWCRAV